LKHNSQVEVLAVPSNVGINSGPNMMINVHAST